MARKLVAVVGAIALLVTMVVPGVARVREPASVGSLDRVLSAPASPVDESQVPHYFGPYPNWANSPLTSPDATVTISDASLPATPLVVGNPLIPRTYPSDITAPGGLPGQGTVLVILPQALPDGTLTNFQTYTQNLPALGSPGNIFNAYVLRPNILIPGEFSIVFDSGSLTVPLAEPDGVHTWTVSTPVQLGDQIGFYGQGIPLDLTGNDSWSYPVLSAPTSPFTPAAPLTGRTYSFSATVQPPSGPGGGGAGATAEATVGANGAITGLTITNPGHDYAAATVAITGSGTLATASADVQTSGAVTSVFVDVAGGGYTAPTVTFSGGNGTTQATGHALGGVDAVTVALADQGANYSFPTVDFDLPDDPDGIQAQGHATCDPVPPVTVDCTGATDMGQLKVTGVVVDNAGSGYSSAPAVVIRDGTPFDPINPPAGFVEAKATATLKILSVVVDTFGDGYTSAPDVTFGGGGATAHATASTDFGAVIALHLLTPGSGYVTPGGIKKFVDGLPGLGDTPESTNNLGQYIPVAKADTTTFPDDPLTTTVNEGADYYVIGVVQHRERMSSSLPLAGTLLREYVQLSSPGQTGTVPLVQDNFDGTTSDIMMPNGLQAMGIDEPHYLGPTIVASKDRPVRIVFYNLLPKGAAGNLFLPTDTSLMGSGPNADAPEMATDPNGLGTVMDDIRNPMCTYNPQMADCYSQNRATLHLHGGVTPWISDGTPHQWITPALDSVSYPQGVSVQNVPDMIGTAKPAGVPDCNADDDGCQTFYYTNQQSARLMFYHDHAWGITRLNVYAGEAAGYVLTDPTEQKLFGPSGTYAAMGEGIPLVIQDRTFVPSPAQLAGQDPTWDSSKWGGMGNLWYHHVYMPAQNPGDPGGMSAYGRWMYGPWFWPPATPQNAPIANPYYNMDPLATPPFSQPLTDSGLHDGSGNPMPCNLDVPSTWQYQVEPFCEPPQIPGTPNISVGMEQFNDTPIVNGTAYPTKTLKPQSYRFRILNAANDRFWNLQWYIADNNGTRNDPSDDILTEVALNPAEVAAAQTDPNISPTPDLTKSPAGPDWVQFGSEGGFLPAPTVVDGQQVTTWITDPTRFDVGNVDKHSLLLAPAERADVIVDFSQFKGKTLILYNDAPAAFPARVPSYDYYTGANGILPGYGPNTRTVMQVTIEDITPAGAFNVNSFKNLFTHKANGSGVFEASQDPIIVGQAGYNSAYGKSFVASGDCTNPNGTNKCDGLARINQQGGQLFRFDNLKASNPQLKVKIEPKALHDEMNSAAFDEFGRMTANLGLEAVPATPAGQNILLYPYIAPPTEVINGTNLPKGDVNIQPISSGTDGTQIWKITHNGVDTHPIHFHLFNVQILNRVTWDNIIIPTEPSELGWKETVRISPLEDTIVALRPIIPTLPFEVPNAIRPLSPMMPLGADLDPNGLIVDPNGNVTTVTNALVNFGWEYVYHCHILSHEEMDMMRPVLTAVPPRTPDGLAASTSMVGGDLTVNLSWNDQSIAETSHVIQRLTVGFGTWVDVGTIQSPLDQPNTTSPRTFDDSTVALNTAYQYRIVARNTVGYGGAYPVTVADSVSGTVDVAPVIPPDVPASPSGLTAALAFGPLVGLQWVDNATTESGFTIERCAGASCTNLAAIDGVGADATAYTDATAALGTTYRYRVYAFNGAGNSLGSNIASVVVPARADAPTNLVLTAQGSLANGPQVRVVFRDNNANTPNPETGFQIFRSDNGGAFALLTTLPPRGGVGNVTYFDTAVAGGGTYAYYVVTINAGSGSSPTNTATVSLPSAPAAPSNFAATTQVTGATTARVNMIWTDNSNNESRFVVQRATDAAFTANLFASNRGANSTAWANTGLPRGTAFYYRIRAENQWGVSAWVALNPSPIVTP